MLVATARGSMARGVKEQSTSSSWPRDSRIMLTPMMVSSTKAIQWSMLVIMFWNCTPSSQPSRGIRA